MIEAELSRLRLLCDDYESRFGIKTSDLSGLVRSGDLGLSVDTLKWLLSAHTRQRLEEMTQELNDTNEIHPN